MKISAYISGNMVNKWLTLTRQSKKHLSSTPNQTAELCGFSPSASVSSNMHVYVDQHQCV